MFFAKKENISFEETKWLNFLTFYAWIWESDPKMDPDLKWDPDLLWDPDHWPKDPDPTWQIPNGQKYPDPGTRIRHTSNSHNYVYQMTQVQNMSPILRTSKVSIPKYLGYWFWLTFGDDLDLPGVQLGAAAVPQGVQAQRPLHVHWPGTGIQSRSEFKSED